MSDFGDDLECLKIHLGGRLSESSDSGDDNELDEEYHLLRPSPIPADKIRQKSIYRPPSPIKEVNNCNLLHLYGSEGPEPKNIMKNMSLVNEKKQQKVQIADVERIISFHQNIAKDLINIQGELVSYSEKLSLAYLKVLDIFQINLDCFGNSLGNLDLKRSIAINSTVSSEKLVNIKSSIDDFNLLLSYLYAFIISEYLLILSEAAKMRKSKVNLIIIKTLDLIDNIGNLDEIKTKIQLRSTKKIVDPNFNNLIPLLLNNEDIISRLYLLSSKIDKNKKRRKKVNTTKLNLEAYADYKKTVSIDESNLGPKTSDNKKKIPFHNGKESLSQLDLIEKDSDILNPKLQNYESSVIDCKNHGNKVIEETDLSVAVSPPKKKRKRKKKLLNSTESMKMFKIENSSKDNNESKENLELYINDDKSFIGHMKNSHLSDHISCEEMELSKYRSNFDTTSKIFNKMNHKEMKTVLMSMKMLVQEINVLNILQYGMNTFEIKHTEYVIILLNDFIKILKTVENYNKLLFVLCPTELVKGLVTYYVPISELCLAHFYAYLLHFCCVFVKTLTNQDIQDKSKELHLQIIKIIKSLGNFKYICSKIKFRNDDLYFQLAQKVCLFAPVISTPFSNSEILQDLTQIQIFSEDTRFNELELENIVRNRNDVLQMVINTIIPQKPNDIENLQLDLKKIEILSILQDNIYNTIECTTELDSLFENMQNFLILLGQLDNQEDSEPDNDCIVNDILINVNKLELATLTISTILKKILNRFVVKIFISHFYCFFLFMFKKSFDLMTPTATKIEKKHSFHLELFEKFIIFCPLQKLPEKLEFRNDAIYEIFMKLLLPIKGVVIDKPSWNILNECLVIFKIISNIYRAYPYLSLHVQVKEFERNISWTKKLKEGIDFYPGVSPPIKKMGKKSKKKKKLLGNAESTKVFDIDDTLKNCEESKQNSKVLNISTAEDNIVPEKSSHIYGNYQIEFEEMKLSKYQCNFNFSSKMFNNLDHKKIEMVIVSIEKLVKGINVMNILQNTMNTSEISYIESVITLLNDYTIILKNVFSYNNLLIAFCSPELLKVMETYYIPVSDLFLAHSYAYLSYFCCEFLNVLRKQNMQDNTDKIYLHIMKVIESLGTFEYIHSKLTVRDDELYIELAEKVCLLTPVFCIRSSNMEILRGLYQIRNNSDDESSIQIDSAFENKVPNKSEDLQIVINTILPRNFQEMEDSQFDLRKILLLSNLQDNIYQTIKNTSDVNSLFDNMRNFLVLLEQLEKQDGNGLQNDSFNEDASVNVKKLDLEILAPDTILNNILNRHISRVFVSHFYCFFLNIFVVSYELLCPSGTEKKQDYFHVDLLETMASVCPLQTLPEKLEFRNDAIYEKYMKILLQIEGVVIDKSSWNILNEALTVFEIILNVNSECLSEDLCAQVEQFVGNTLWTKTIIEEKDLTVVLSASKKKTKRRRVKKKKTLCSVESTNLSEIEELPRDIEENKRNSEVRNTSDTKNYFDDKKEEEKKTVTDFENLSCNDLNVLSKEDVENEKNRLDTTATSSGKQMTHKMVELLQACSECEVKNIIIEMMNNSEIADLSMNSVMRKIEYSITKAITVLNVTQYSFSTFEKKNSIAAFFSLLDCLTLVHRFREFSKLILSVSALSKLQEIERSFVPIAKVCQAYFYAYILSTSCELIRVLESDNTENEIYAGVLIMVKSFGTHEEIYEKLKYRNDYCYIDIVQQCCTVIPSTLWLADNDYILKNIPYIEDIQEERKKKKETKEFEIMSEKLGMVTENLKIRKFRYAYSDFECSQIDLNQLKIIINLQYDINFYDQFPTNFFLIFENMINFFTNLKTFEQDKHQLSACGSFVDKFLEFSENILCIHISRILVAQFYSFIFSACIGFLKNLAELVPKNEVSFFHSKLINLFNENCSIDEVFKKMQYRNDTFFSQYITDVLKMKVIKVDKSYEEIHSELLYILNMNQI